MATTTVTLIGDVSDAIGVDFDANTVDVSISYNTPKVVTDTGLRLGGHGQKASGDGTFSLPNVVAATSMADNLQATVRVSYRNTARRTREEVTLGPYDLTGMSGTVDVRTLETVQALDASVASQYMTQLADGVADAEAARDQAQALVLSDLGTTDGQTRALIQNPASQSAIALAASTARSVVNAVKWTPTPGANAAQNATSLQAAVTAAVAGGQDVLLDVVGSVDVAGPIEVAGRCRIFGYGRSVTTIHHTAKPTYLFHVTAQNVTVEDFTVSGDGLNFTDPVALFQFYSAFRVPRTSHGFTARRLGFKDIYVGLMFRKDTETSATTESGDPGRLKRLVVEDITSDGCWAALHGGPFDAPYINNVRGNVLPATGHASTAGHAPHLVYINTSNPTSGTYTDAFYTLGGTVTNINGVDGPDYVGGMLSAKYCRGTMFDQITARGFRGILEMLGLIDCKLTNVNSTDDKYPGTGSDSTRSSVAMSSCTRTTVSGGGVRFANVDHGRGVFIESTNTDCWVENFDVIDNSTVDRTSDTQNADSAYRIAGTTNGLRNVRATNIGQPKWTGINLATTGTGGRCINPRVGDGYQQKVRIQHNAGFVDYEPTDVLPARDVSGAVSILNAATLAPILRDRSVGQAVAKGFVDELTRSKVVNGFAYSDDLKLWIYADSGGGLAGNPASWQATGTAAKYIGAGARAVACLNGGSPDGTLRTTVGALSNSTSAGLAIWITDWNNYVGLTFNYGAGDGKVDLFKRVAGTRTSLAQSASSVITAASVVEVIPSGTSVSVKVGGVQVIAAQVITDVPRTNLHGLLSAATETALTYDRVEFVAA